jgi:hypothetical protein
MPIAQFSGKIYDRLTAIGFDQVWWIHPDGDPGLGSLLLGEGREGATMPASSWFGLCRR